LSSKVTTILSTSYADLDIRDALGALDARNVKNTAETRRNLRLDVQKEIIDCNAVVIQDFGLVAKVVVLPILVHSLSNTSQQLSSVGTALETLQKTVAEMRRHISAARVETAPILEEANRLFAQNEAVETKQKLLAAFNAHFLLSEAETVTLTSTAEPVTDNFFQVLVKAKRINRDSQLLLSGENQRLGLEILDQSTRHLTAAFQKLHRWVQREFKSLDLENLHINAGIRRALRVLAERKAMFDSALDTFAQARQRTLSDAFYAALTGSGNRFEAQDRQKPIEFSAHEPLRYIGDMLAWVHATTVSERESLETLFIYEGDEIAKGIREGLESEPWRTSGDQTRGEEQFNGPLALEQLVSSNLSGVAALVRQRIEQVILSHDEPVLAYKIVNLIHFYRAIFAKINARVKGFQLQQQSSLIVMLDGLADSALSRFTATMQYAAATALDNHELTTIPDDLSPPYFFTDALDTLSALLSTYDSSASMSDPSGAGLSLLLTEALDPFLTACNHLATTIPNPTDSAIFSANCLLAALTTLSTTTTTSTPHTETLRTQLTAHANQLTILQHTFLLSTSSLSTLTIALDALTNHKDFETLSQNPAFSPESLLATSERLDAFLPHALTDAALNLRRLRDVRLRREIMEEAAGMFVEDFERVEESVRGVDEVLRRDGAYGVDDGEEGLRECFPRTGEEIRVLLS